MKTVAEVVGNGHAWFQLYFSKDRDLTMSLFERAEAAGYSAIVVTVDTPTVIWRCRNRQNWYFPRSTGGSLLHELLLGPGSSITL